MILQENHEHCGSCYNTCRANEYCIEGRCRLVCPEGKLACSGQCIDPQTDPNHCGICGGRCVSGVCQKSQCVIHADQVGVDDERLCFLEQGQLRCW
ncbi:MAG: hypothetical protein AAGJ35_05610, partial [Myxococcota bacterium]